jgi:hypothetical protein
MIMVIAVASAPGARMSAAESATRAAAAAPLEVGRHG